jgi:Cupin
MSSPPCVYPGRSFSTSPPNRRGLRRPPPGPQIAKEVTAGAQHAIEYHVVTRGSCWISLIGGAGFDPVKLDEGDIAVIPHGDPHVISSAPGMRAEPNLDMHRRPADSNALPFTLRTGGEGASDTM